MWIGGRCLGARLPIYNPFVDGGGEAMLLAIRDFVFIRHPLALNINQRIEVAVAEASVHARLCLKEERFEGRESWSDIKRGHIYITLDRQCC